MVLKNIPVLIALLFSLPAFPQTIEGKNMAKLNLSSLAFKGFNLQYERQVSQKVTVALSYGMIPSSSVPYKSYIEKNVYIPNVNVAEFSLGTYIFTPEVRYYFGRKGAFHGFYLAPYSRIGIYKINGPVVYINNANTKEDAFFAGKLTAITGGILAGSSWQLSERFYLDCWIAGGSFGGESGKFTTRVQLSAGDQASLKKELESISLSGITLTSEVNNNGAIVTSSGSTLGLRGLGINFGIRF